METKLPVADSAPYPPIEVQGQDAAYARMMLESMAGCHSEMSNIGLYVYASTVLEERCPKASVYFHKIAVVEMRHLGMLSQLALLLGADPRLWSHPNNRAAYWDPSCIPYTRDLPALLSHALTGENKAIEEYRRQIEKISDPCVKAVLERIVLDEEKHVTIFRCLHQEYSPQPRGRKASF